MRLITIEVKILEMNVNDRGLFQITAILIKT